MTYQTKDFLNHLRRIESAVVAEQSKLLTDEKHNEYALIYDCIDRISELAFKWDNDFTFVP